MLLNLVVNSRDALPDGGTVTIETGDRLLDESYAPYEPDLRAGTYVMIAVSDIVEQLRASAPELPVLSFSGHTSEVLHRGDALQQERTAFIGKPFAASDLVGRLAGLLAVG